MKWQPIETAPKDGEWILAYQPDYQILTCAHVKIPARLSPTGGDIDGWYFGDMRKLMQPTHWMPLPASPRDQPSDEEPQSGDTVGTADTVASLTQQIISLRADVSNAERRAEDAEARNVFLETEIAMLYAKVAKP